MNKLMTVVVGMMLTFSSFANDGFNKLYSEYSKSDQVTSLNITKSLIKIASRFMGEDDKEIKAILEGIESVKLLASDNGNNDGFIADAQRMMKSAKFEDLIKINDGGDHVRVMVREEGDIIKEVLILANSDNEFALINIIGEINPEEIGKMLETLDIEVGGLDQLNVR